MNPFLLCGIVEEYKDDSVHCVGLNSTMGIPQRESFLQGSQFVFYYSSENVSLNPSGAHTRETLTGLTLCPHRGLEQTYRQWIYFAVAS